MCTVAVELWVVKRKGYSCIALFVLTPQIHRLVDLTLQPVSTGRYDRHFAYDKNKNTLFFTVLYGMLFYFRYADTNVIFEANKDTINI